MFCHTWVESYAWFGSVEENCQLWGDLRCRIRYSWIYFIERVIFRSKIAHWRAIEFLSSCSRLRDFQNVWFRNLRILGSLRKHDVDRSVTSRFCNHFSIIQSHHAWKMCSKYPGIKLETAPGRYKKTKLNICDHMLSSSTQLQNRSFYVVERTRTSSKCQKMKNARAKRAKILFFIVKYANLWVFCCLSSSWLLSDIIWNL